MLIDFHVHLFPDKLAGRTLTHLKEVSGGSCCTDGTVAGTLKALNEWDVDYGVVLPIATRAGQCRTINDFAVKVQDENKKLLSFGSVLPKEDCAIEELHRIREIGLHGVKLHPAYQECHFGDDEYFPLYAEIEKLGLPVTVHAGWDPVSPVNYSTGEEIAKVAKAFPDLKLIAAHMGGLNCYEDAMKYVVGLPNVYLDTAVASIFFKNPAQYRDMIRAHGVDRVLLATDCPWSTIPAELGLLQNCGLTGEELEKITCRNACKLLGIPLEK